MLLSTQQLFLNSDEGQHYQRGCLQPRGLGEVINELLNYLVPQEVICIFATRKTSYCCEGAQLENAAAGTLHICISLRGLLKRVLVINKPHGVF